MGNCCNRREDNPITHKKDPKNTESGGEQIPILKKDSNDPENTESGDEQIPILKKDLKDPENTESGDEQIPILKKDSNDPDNFSNSENADLNSKKTPPHNFSEENELNTSRVKTVLQNTKKCETNIENKIPQKKYKSSGLNNKGNTCFMNSTLQAIAHFSEFSEIFQELDSKNQSLIYLLTKLVKSMITSTEVECNLTKFVECLNKISCYGNGSQEDAKSFYIFIINEIQKCFESSGKSKVNFHKHILSRQILILGNSIEKPIENFLTVLESSSLDLEDIENDINSSLSPMNYNDYDDPTEFSENFEISNILAIGFNNLVSIRDMNYVFKIQDRDYLMDFFVIKYGSSIYSGHAVAVARENDRFIYYNDSQVTEYRKNSVSGCLLIFLKIK